MREYLDKLEQLISEQDIKKVYALFLLILVLTLFAIYYFFIEPEIESLSQKQASILSLEKKIQSNSLKTVQNRLKVKKREVLKNKNILEKTKLKILSIKTKLIVMHLSFVDPVVFSNFLNYMLKKSVADNLLIENLTIDDQKKDFLGKIYIKKEIFIEGSGKFLNIIKFAREVEGEKILFNIRDFNIETYGSLPKFSFKIDFYGVKE